MKDYWAGLRECRALVMDCRALLREYRVLEMD